MTPTTTARVPFSLGSAFLAPALALTLVACGADRGEKGSQDETCRVGLAAEGCSSSHAEGTMWYNAVEETKDGRTRKVVRVLTLGVPKGNVSSFSLTTFEQDKGATTETPLTRVEGTLVVNGGESPGEIYSEAGVRKVRRSGTARYAVRKTSCAAYGGLVADYSFDRTGDVVEFYRGGDRRAANDLGSALSSVISRMAKQDVRSVAKDPFALILSSVASKDAAGVRAALAKAKGRADLDCVKSLFDAE